MEKGLKELLESVVLSEDTKSALLEAWEQKLEEVKKTVREETEIKVREEFANRYSADKNELIDAMDRMLNDTVREHATSHASELKALKEERIRLTKAVRETRKSYKNRISEHVKMLEKFVQTQLKEELVELAHDHKALQNMKVRLAREISMNESKYSKKLSENTSKLQKFVFNKLHEELSKLNRKEQLLAETKVYLAKKLQNHHAQLDEQTASRMNKLEKFVVEQLTKELKEFEQDKKELVEAKVKLVSESKAKLNETRKQFIKRASSLVESTVKNTLRNEIVQMKEDIRIARENNFGRKIFEKFFEEFMTSYLSEGTHLKKMSKTLHETKKMLNEKTRILAESENKIKVLQRQVKLSEDRAIRAKTINSLLTPLSKEKRIVMEELLETTKTSDLKEAFQKYLPAVLNETVRGSVSKNGKKQLNEVSTKSENKTISITGNRINRLAESARAEDVQTNEVDELRRLAGIL